MMSPRSCAAMTLPFTAFLLVLLFFNDTAAVGDTTPTTPAAHQHHHSGPLSNGDSYAKIIDDKDYSMTPIVIPSSSSSSDPNLHQPDQTTINANNNNNNNNNNRAPRKSASPQTPRPPRPMPSATTIQSDDNFYINVASKYRSRQQMKNLSGAFPLSAYQKLVDETWGWAALDQWINSRTVYCSPDEQHSTDDDSHQAHHHHDVVVDDGVIRATIDANAAVEPATFQRNQDHDVVKLPKGDLTCYRWTQPPIRTGMPESPQAFCTASNVRFDMSKLYRSNSIREMFDFEPGALQANCRFNRTVQGSNKIDFDPTDEQRTGFHYVMAKALTSFREFDDSNNQQQKEEETCSQWIEHPVYLVTRYDYINLYHMMTDWYNVWLTSLVTGIPISEWQIMFIDRHPESRALDPIWQELYSPNHNIEHLFNYKIYSLMNKDDNGDGTNDVDDDNKKQQQQQQQRRSRRPNQTLFGNRAVCFKKLILHNQGYNSPLDWGGGQVTPWVQGELLRGFSNHILASYGLLQKSADEVYSNKRKVPRVTMIFRRDYKAHAGKPVLRKIKNEQEVMQVLSKGTQMIVREVDLAKLSFREQVELMQETDVLVGVHGAGLTLLMFLPEDSVVVELGDGNNFMFRNLAKAYNKVYVVGASDVPHGEEYYTVDVDKFERVMDGAMRIARNIGWGAMDCGLVCTTSS